MFEHGVICCISHRNRAEFDVMCHHSPHNVVKFGSLTVAIGQADDPFFLRFNVAQHIESAR